jgi:hypothetical protein
MTTRTKKRLDYLPYTVLILSAVYLIYSRISGDILLQLRHVAGLVLLPLPAVLFFYRHKLGVLSLGLVILSGLVGGISYSPAIHTITFGKSLNNGDSFPLLYFQPIFLLWALLHFTLSGRYYTGIASKKYWENIKSDEPMKI